MEIRENLKKRGNTLSQAHVSTDNFSQAFSRGHFYNSMESVFCFSVNSEEHGYTGESSLFMNHDDEV